MSKCYLCPQRCGADRTKRAGACGATDEIAIAKYYPHMYEEPILSGTRGSGTIFFTGCSLRCVFCQNYDLSRVKTGKKITPKELADIFKELEDMGVHNVNLVTPTHFVDRIAEAFEIYRPHIPVVYNTHSYEPIETLEMIDKYVDIYLPDMKFYSPSLSERYTGKKDYFEVAKTAIEYMMDKKTFSLSPDGMMKSGVIVRHMIMPLGAADSRKILEWFASAEKNGAYISLMAQYTPFGEYERFPELKRRITAAEYDRVYEKLLSLGIERYFIQELKAASESFIPKWDF